MVCLFPFWNFNLENTDFGKKYARQNPQKNKSTEKMHPWNSLDKPIINEICIDNTLSFKLHLKQDKIFFNVYLYSFIYRI